jgi:hypothetical protein
MYDISNGSGIYSLNIIMVMKMTAKHKLMGEREG